MKTKVISQKENCFVKEKMKKLQELKDEATLNYLRKVREEKVSLRIKDLIKNGMNPIYSNKAKDLMRLLDMGGYVFKLQGFTTRQIAKEILSFFEQRLKARAENLPSDIDPIGYIDSLNNFSGEKTMFYQECLFVWVLNKGIEILKMELAREAQAEDKQIRATFGEVNQVLFSQLELIQNIFYPNENEHFLVSTDKIFVGGILLAEAEYCLEILKLL